MLAYDDLLHLSEGKADRSIVGLKGAILSLKERIQPISYATLPTMTTESRFAQSHSRSIGRLNVCTTYTDCDSPLLLFIAYSRIAHTRSLLIDCPSRALHCNCTHTYTRSHRHTIPAVKFFFQRQVPWCSWLSRLPNTQKVAASIAAGIKFF